MVIGIIGESCTGKSTIAKQLQDILSAEVITGKEYMHLYKNSSTAKRLFEKQLKETKPDDVVIYVITEQEHVSLLPEDAIKVLVQEELHIIKERFKERMKGTLPPPVEKMLERKHGMFDTGEYDLVLSPGLLHERVDKVGTRYYQSMSYRLDAAKALS